jgi:predicted short-subunit dehydrogenase-like oxidoreductase (DUF2520 family)
MSKNQIKTVIIGSGNVAWSLAHYLPYCGCSVVQIVSRTQENAQSLAQSIGADYSNNFHKIFPFADFYIYAITDECLLSVIDSIRVENGIHLHTSGSVGIDVFEGKKNKFGVLYPFQTFSKYRQVNFKYVPIFIEANADETLTEINHLADKISDNVLILNGMQRKMAHLAGIFGNNFVNYLLGLSYKILKNNHLPSEIILPLVRETLEKFEIMSPQQAQSGPAARGNKKIIDEHLSILYENKELYDVYNLLSNKILIQNY